MPIWWIALLWSWLCVSTVGAQELEFNWEIGPTGTQASLRGLDAPSDQTVWACGSSATVIRSQDGGSSWIECGPTDFAWLEFRSIHAWDSNSACIASAGTPAVILRTTDGGRSWQEVYRHASPDAFLDGLKFWDEQRGIAFGDPIDGKFLVVESQDGGRTWAVATTSDQPGSLEAEAAFAASNSAMHLGDNGRVWIGTGGQTGQNSRIFTREDWDTTWVALPSPMRSGSAEGIFSLAYDGQSQRLVAVGGDYRAGEPSATVAAYSDDGGIQWKLADQPPSEFRSAVVRSPPLDRNVGWFLATGPSGTDVSEAGENWRRISDTGFHALAVPRRPGSSVMFAAGADGKFAVLRWR